VVLVRGAGVDFCSGANLSGLHEEPKRQPARKHDGCPQNGGLFVEMRRHPHPIIAAYKAARSLEDVALATAADVVLALSRQDLGYPEVEHRLRARHGDGDPAPLGFRETAFELITTAEIIPRKRHSILE